MRPDIYEITLNYTVNWDDCSYLILFSRAPKSLRSIWLCRPASLSTKHSWQNCLLRGERFGLSVIQLALAKYRFQGRSSGNDGRLASVFLFSRQREASLPVASVQEPVRAPARVPLWRTLERRSSSSLRSSFMGTADIPAEWGATDYSDGLRRWFANGLWTVARFARQSQRPFPWWSRWPMMRLACSRTLMTGFFVNDIWIHIVIFFMW